MYLSESSQMGQGDWLPGTRSSHRGRSVDPCSRRWLVLSCLAHMVRPRSLKPTTVACCHRGSGDRNPLAGVFGTLPANLMCHILQGPRNRFRMVPRMRWLERHHIWYPERAQSVLFSSSSHVPPLPLVYHPFSSVHKVPLQGQTIVLSYAEIHTSQQNLTIQGSHITVREIGAGLVVEKHAHVTISGLTFQGSNTESQPALIQNQGNLTLKNCIISGNISGGIHNDSGTITITNSTISGNTADFGGGIHNQAASLSLIFWTVTNNGPSFTLNDGFDITTDEDISPPQTCLKASIVGGSDTQHNPIAGMITSDGYNIIQRMSSENFSSSPAHATDHSVDD